MIYLFNALVDARINLRRRMDYIHFARRHIRGRFSPGDGVNLKPIELEIEIVPFNAVPPLICDTQLFVQDFTIMFSLHNLSRARGKIKKTTVGYAQMNGVQIWTVCKPQPMAPTGVCGENPDAFQSLQGMMDELNLLAMTADETSGVPDDTEFAKQLAGENRFWLPAANYGDCDECIEHTNSGLWFYEMTCKDGLCQKVEDEEYPVAYIIPKTCGPNEVLDTVTCQCVCKEGWVRDFVTDECVPPCAPGQVNWYGTCYTPRPPEWGTCTTCDSIPEQPYPPAQPVGPCPPTTRSTYTITVNYSYTSAGSRYESTRTFNLNGPISAPYAVETLASNGRSWSGRIWIQYGPTCLLFMVHGVGSSSKPDYAFTWGYNVAGQCKPVYGECIALVKTCRAVLTLKATPKTFYSGIIEQAARMYGTTFEPYYKTVTMPGTGDSCEIFSLQYNAFSLSWEFIGNSGSIVPYFWTNEIERFYDLSITSQDCICTYS